MRRAKKLFGRLTCFLHEKYIKYILFSLILEKISPERKRSSRVAGKPQLIRSDMLLPVKSQNTTLFAVTCESNEDDNDDDNGG